MIQKAVVPAGRKRARLSIVGALAISAAVLEARPAEAQVNLALGRPASGSLPCNANEGPAKAVNGSVSGGNGDKWCSLQPVKFLQVDLGAALAVGRVVVRHAGAGGESASFNTRDFGIQVSTDGASFTTVATATGNAQSATTHDLGVVTARFVRLNVTAPEQGGGGAARIYELEVHPPANLALNKPATGSAPCNANEGPAKAVNGSVSGGNRDKWCSLAATRFLQVDLGGSGFAVDRFVVRHAGAGGESASFNTRDFSIQVGPTATSLTTVVTATANTQSVTTHAITSRTARFVRLNVTTPTQTGNAAARIYELEVYGSGGGPLPPPATLADWIGSHGVTLSRHVFDDHVALYVDANVDRDDVGWVLPFTSQAFQYAKRTYDPVVQYGPDRLYAFLHQGQFGGGTISSWFDAFSGFRNATDTGAGSWVRGTNIDLISHEMAHIVEGSSNGVHESPAFTVWGDSKWAEFFQYDVYVALGLQQDADRVFARFMDTRDGFPRPNTAWFRDWFFPLWRDHGGAPVMARFFRLLSQHFPTRLENGGRNPIYTRRMNLGEFVHFTSGAAGTDLSSLATAAFGPGWEAQLQQARQDFPGVAY